MCLPLHADELANCLDAMPPWTGSPPPKSSSATVMLEIDTYLAPGD